MRISVFGGGTVSPETYETAEAVGEQLAANGHEVVCGGLTGVMEGVCRGVERVGGHSIGILPGEDPAAANRYVGTVITTGLGQARNVLVAQNGDAAIAIDGAAGTLSEIGHALKTGLPVAGIDTHDVPGVAAVDGPRAAVEYVERSVS